MDLFVFSLGGRRLMSVIRIKRGASLSLTVTFATASGSPVSPTGWTLTAQIRDAERTFVEDLPIVQTAVAGQAQIVVQDTSGWPEGLLRFDVLAVAADGTRSISETAGVYVDKAVTETLAGPAPYDPVTA